MEKCLDVGFNKESKLVKIRIRNGIIKFCNLNYPGFDSDVEYERINKVMEEVYKTNLRESLPVPITKKEWEDIEKASTEETYGNNVNTRELMRRKGKTTSDLY